MIPLNRQNISKQDLKSVNKALKSDFYLKNLKKYLK